MAQVCYVLYLEMKELQSFSSKIYATCYIALCLELSTGRPKITAIILFFKLNR